MADEEKSSEEKKPKKGSPLVLIIVAFLFVVLLAVVGMIGFFMFQSPDDTAAAGGAAPATPTAQGGKGKGSAATSAARGSDYSNIGPMYPLDSFTLNLLSDGGARYIKCTLQLEQNTDLLQPELDKKTAIIRDVVIRTLTSKTFEEVSTSKGKERLKDELVSKINEVLTDGFVKNIYFTDFVVQ